MDTNILKINRMWLYAIIILLFVLLFKQCQGKTSSTPINKEPITTIIRDTVWQTKRDTFKVQTVKYKTVYVNKTDISKVIDSTDEVAIPPSHLVAKVYQDTLSNEDIDIFSYNLLDGNLLDSQLSYKLKVPREITITKTMEQPKTFRSGLYLFSEIGGNTQTFNNISLGLQYNHKGKWFASYSVNLNQLQQPTHNIGVGFRLF